MNLALKKLLKNIIKSNSINGLQKTIFYINIIN